MTLVSQREEPRLTLVRPEFKGDSLVISIQEPPGGFEQSEIRDTVANMTTAVLITPLEPRSNDYAKTQVHMFGKDLEGLDLGDEAATFFSEFLGFPCRFVHKSPDEVRPVKEHSPGVAEIGYQPEMAFADQFPILALSEESIQDINARLDNPVSVINFRANLIIEGCSEPFEEDKWCEVDIGGITYYFTCRCPRCSMPNINVETAVKDKMQPQKTLQSIRRVDRGKMAKYKACVGMNVVPSKTSGSLRVGDAVIVKSVYQGERLRTGEERWITSQE
ncbi:Mitochondrial amidoxime reducing component 2 [Actinomortierella ambigua]|nr:Mitochondrial amidoxime reducing component 2 [Actinomortierella ambigua]